jgi:hypothetical protein
MGASANDERINIDDLIGCDWKSVERETFVL